MRLEQALSSLCKMQAKDGAAVLDVGCGNRPYEGLFKNCSYIGLDVENSGRSMALKQPDYFYDGKKIPFKSESFDVLLSTQVLEHVANPPALLNEMFRVLKVGGVLIISLPFVFPEHEQPFDYYRFTRFGVVELLEGAGFQVQEIKRDTCTIEAMAVLFNLYLVANLVPKIRGFGFLVSVLICFPIQLLSLVLSKLLPDNGGFYLNLVVIGSKGSRANAS